MYHDRRMRTLPRQNVSRLTGVLLRAAQRARCVNVAALFAVVVSGLALTLFGIFVLDIITGFPVPVRVLLGASALVAFGVVLPRRFARFCRRDRDPVSIARRLEGRMRKMVAGGFRSLIVSAVEFGTNRGLTGSGELKDCVISAAHRRSADAARVALHHHPLVRAAVRLTPAAAVVYLLWSLLAWSFFAVFFQRLIGLPVAYPTRTQIVRLEFPRVSPRYDPIRVTVAATGELPTSGRMRVAFAGESPFDLKLEAGEEAGFYLATIPSPAKDLTFSVFIGDASSEPCQIRVPNPPEVATGIMEISPPAYTWVAPRTLSLANIDVPENSRFDLTVRPDRPVVTCELDLGEKRYPLKRVEGGAYMLRRVRLHSSKRYSIRLVDRDGIENRDRVFYYMNVIADQLPTVALERPRNEGYWAPISRLRWVVAASDDYGMASARLKCEIAEPTESGKDRIVRSVDIELPSFEGIRESRVGGKLDLVRLGAVPGQTLILSVLVQDNCDFREGEASGVSQGIRLHLVTPPDLRRIIEEEELMVSKGVEDLAEDVARQIRILEMQERLQSGEAP